MTCTYSSSFPFPLLPPSLQKKDFTLGGGGGWWMVDGGWWMVVGGWWESFIRGAELSISLY